MTSRRSSTEDYPQALLLPLQLIEPSPLHSPVISEHGESPPKDLHFPRGIGYWLGKTHRWSSYVFSGFLGVHFVTVAAIPLASFSLEAGDRSVLLTRVVYQNPFIEPLVFGSLGVHVLSGLGLRSYRKYQKVRKFGSSTPWYKEMSRLSVAGYVLVPLVALHSALTRGIPWSVLGGSEDIGLGYIGYGLTEHPWFTWPLYLSISSIGTYHVVQGWAKWLQLQIPRRWTKTIDRGTVALAGTWFAAIILIARTSTSTGHLARLYERLYKAFFVRVL